VPLAVPFWQCHFGSLAVGSAILAVWQCHLAVWHTHFGSFGSWQCHLAVGSANLAVPFGSLAVGIWQCHWQFGSWYLAVPFDNLFSQKNTMATFNCKYCDKVFKSSRSQYRHQGDCVSNPDRQNESDLEIEETATDNQLIVNESPATRVQEPVQPRLSNFNNTVPVSNFQERITTTKTAIHHQHPSKDSKDPNKILVETLADLLFNSVDAIVENGIENRFDNNIIKAIINGDEQFSENIPKLDKYFHALCEDKKKELKRFNDTLELMMGNNIRNEDLDEIFNLINDEKINLAERQYQMKLCKLKGKMWEKDIMQIGLDKTILVSDKIRSVMKEIVEDDNSSNYNNYLNMKKTQHNITKIKNRLWMRKNKIVIVAGIFAFIAIFVGVFMYYNNLMILYIGSSVVLALLAMIAFLFYY
jgi:hypothetical protein